MMRSLDKITTLLAVVAIGLNEWLLGLYQGVSYGGSHICNYMYPTIKSSTGSFWISDSDPYMYLGNFARLISFAILIFIAVKLFENKVLVKALSLIPLGAGLWWWLRCHEIIEGEIQQADIYVDALRESHSAHFALLGFLVGLLILQITSLCVQIHYGRKPALG